MKTSMLKSAIVLLLMAVMQLGANAQIKEYFGSTPDLKVSGNEFVDPNGRPVSLHGVMDTPNDYFNGARWHRDLYWPVYGDSRAPQYCREYFTKVFDAITNQAGGTYCNLFRLHLDPAWTNDPDKTATNGGGENDISRFSADRLRTYLNSLYIPIAEDALGHGLYVIIRPPGVFPEDVTVGDAYNQYLQTVWDIVSQNAWVKAHPGQVMLELGNEPVRMSGNLADFFQPIVNKIRQNGFTGILLLPGTGYQADYTNYNTKSINDNNYAYAVHNYPGWYGGWDATQTEAQFITEFENKVPVDKKPIVITEVDWSPMKEGAGHWNETHTQYTEGNFGTWATGTTYSPAPNVAYKTTQNVGWGIKFRHLVDKHPNISWTLQGTTTYVDMDSYLASGKIQPAFTDQMKAAGYADAGEACSLSCFYWYYEYACGDRVPMPAGGSTDGGGTEGTTTADAIGNAYFDASNSHYCFYTTYYSSFLFHEFAGKKLIDCADFTIDCGNCTTGYRLDVQLKDNSGNIIKDGTNDYIIGTEEKGTRVTKENASKIYNMQAIFADYIANYPGCTVGDIRINTAIEQNDTDKQGLYYITINKMEMNISQVRLSTPAGSDKVAQAYISGAGYISDEVKALLADTHLTSVDITGMTNKFSQPLTSANPNCIMIYDAAQETPGYGETENLMGSAFDARNLAKKETNGSYDCWTTALVDGYDYLSPVNITTVGGASFSRTLSETEYAAMVLPFELDLSKSNPEIFVLSATQNGHALFSPVTSDKLPAGTAIIYRNTQGGQTTLNGANIVKTVSGLNIQPISGMNGWYTAQSFQHGTIADVATHALLKDYNVYTLNGSQLELVTTTLTLAPFRAYFLQQKSGTAALSTLSLFDGSYDLNHDGKITISDLILVISNLNSANSTYNSSDIETIVKFLIEK